MSDDPVAVQFKYNPQPTTVKTTVAVAQEWYDAVAMLSAEISIPPYVGKCLYFIGIVRHVTDAASKLYKFQYDLPALLLACSMVELLGRCIQGDEKHLKADPKRLKTGFHRIIEVSFPHKRNNDQVVYTSNTQSYSQKDLLALRNFGAHGFSGTYKPDLQIDRLFIGWLLGAIGETLDAYFDELKNSEDAAKCMARAGISPIIFQEFPYERRPIHIKKIYEFLSNDGKPGKFAFEEYWRAEYLKVKSLNLPHSQ